MAQKLKTGLAVIGLSILAIVAVELLARGVFVVRDALSEPDQRAEAPAFSGADYDVREWFEEDGRISSAYQPYVVWRPQPLQGRLINIDQEGNRFTAYNSASEDRLKIWMLGGSTTWGFGVPDDQTVPSQLSRLINQTWGLDAQVRNLGQKGYVSTQEVVYILRQLQSGYRPDVVVLYDGLNDAITAARFPDIPAAHWGFDDTRDKLERGDKKLTALGLVRPSGSLRLVRAVSRRLGISNVAGQERQTTMAEAEIEQLSERSVKIMLENYRIVMALSTEYGFLPIFLFQPGLALGQKPLHSWEEDKLSSGSQDEGLVLRQMRRIIQRRASAGRIPESFYDISDVFANVSEPIYFSSFHISVQGNRIVAGRIFEILQNELCHKDSPQISDTAKDLLISACEGNSMAKVDSEKH